MEVMGAFAEGLDAFPGETCVEAPTKASTKSSMEDLKDLKASTKVASTQASTKASTKSPMQVTTGNASVEAFMEAMDIPRKFWKISRKQTHGSVHESFHQACMKDMQDMKASMKLTLTGTSTTAVTKASMEVTSTKASMDALKRVVEFFSEVTSRKL